MSKRYSDIGPVVNDLPDVLTAGMIAEKFLVSVKTVYRWIHQNSLPVLPMAGPVRISKREFLRWIEVKGKK